MSMTRMIEENFDRLGRESKVMFPGRSHVSEGDDRTLQHEGQHEGQR